MKLLYAIAAVCFATTAAATDSFDKEVYCLAQSLYFESRGEPIEGQLAVANVIKNRIKDNRFPDSICAVVKQTKPSCQFSYHCDGKPDTLPKSKEAKQALYLALILTVLDLPDNTHGALFFHAKHVKPNWKGVKKTVVINNHVFYRGL